MKGLYTKAVAAALSDTVDQQAGFTVMAVCVGTAGTVKVTMSLKGTVTLTLAAGIADGLQVKRVWATGTSATGIVLLGD